MFHFNWSEHEHFSEEQRRKIELKLMQMNYSRLKIIALISIVCEIILICIFDLDVLLSGKLFSNSIDHLYLYSHILIGLVSFGAVLGAYKLYPNELKELSIKHYLFIMSFGGLFLSVVAFITGLDQVTNGQIISFTSMFMIGCILFVVNPLRLVVTFGIPTLIFVVSVMYFQTNKNIEIANITNGLLFAVTISILAIQNYINTYRQIGKGILLEEQNLKLDFLAHHDPLTGLLNRRSFEKEMHFCLTTICDSLFALVLIDIDYFKKVNDVFGHDQADEVLISLTTLLTKMLENSGIIARWGGEEFIALVYDQSIECILATIENMRAAIETQKTHINEAEIFITCSFGVTVIDINEINELKSKFTIVDKALYESKASGRNRITIM